jgi:hypothetical protein
MPSERVYTIRGKVPKALTHTKLQLSSYDPKSMYVIEEFKVMPAGSPTKADCYGTISMGKNDNIDPSDPDFSNQNEIAWAHTGIWQTGTALPASEGVVISTQEINDEKLFNYDIWLHTEDNVGAEEINYFIKIRRYKTGAVEGSIGSLRQYQYNDQENQ